MVLKKLIKPLKITLKSFPERFSWKLTDEESKNLLVKIFDQKNIDTRGGKYKNPRVFTEEGIAMLATILHTPVAAKISIAIMDAFIGIRKFISNSLIEQKHINKIDNNKILEELLKEIKTREY